MNAINSILAKAALFVGHDSGPLHLAAAVGLACVALFGGYNRPRKWHPVGDHHRIIHNMAGVQAISPDEVLEAVLAARAREGRRPPNPPPALPPTAP